MHINILVHMPGKHRKKPHGPANMRTVTELNVGGHDGGDDFPTTNVMNCAV